MASGRTLVQISAGTLADRPARGKRQQASENELPQVAPKLPTLVERPPRGDNWIHELKLDGYRMQVRISAGQVNLITRGGHDWTDRLPELADAVASLSLRSGILDGELVSLTSEGVTDFSNLQAAVAQGRTGQLVIFFFDLLYLNQQLLADRPLLERKANLEPLIRKAANPRLQYLDHVAGSPAALCQACRQRGLEGIVSKRVDHRYRGGRASDWLKTKHRRRDRFVIGGAERSSNAVACIGVLAVGYFDPVGKFIYCGKVSGGWTQAVGESMLKSLESDRAAKSPFAPSFSSSAGPTAKTSWQASGSSASTLWVRPQIVVEIFFQRHPRKATPSAMKSISVASEAESFLNIADLEGLVATAQMNAIEIHPWGSRIDRVDRPDRVVLDLDPDPAVLWPEIVDAAWTIRNELREHGLTSFVKTSGGKGLHIVIPIARRYAWERVG